MILIKNGLVKTMAGEDIENGQVLLDGGKIVEEAAPAEFFDRPKTERAQRFLRTFTFDAVK